MRKKTRTIWFLGAFAVCLCGIVATVAIFRFAQTHDSNPFELAWTKRVRVAADLQRAIRDHSILWAVNDPNQSQSRVDNLWRKAAQLDLDLKLSRDIRPLFAGVRLDKEHNRECIVFMYGIAPDESLKLPASYGVALLARYPERGKTVSWIFVDDLQPGMFGLLLRESDCQVISASNDPTMPSRFHLKVRAKAEVWICEFDVSNFARLAEQSHSLGSY